MEKLKHDVLLELSCHALDWINSVYPLSSILISKSLKKPLKDVRKVLQELKADGYVYSCKVCYIGEERNCILNGWKITNKAISTDEYEIAKKKEEQYLEEIKKQIERK